MTRSANLALFVIILFSVSLLASERQDPYDNIIPMDDLLNKYNASIANYENFIKVQIPSFKIRKSNCQQHNTSQIYLALNQKKSISEYAEFHRKGEVTKEVNL